MVMNPTPINNPPAKTTARHEKRTLRALLIGPVGGDIVKTNHFYMVLALLSTGVSVYHN